MSGYRASNLYLLSAICLTGIAFLGSFRDFTEHEFVADEVAVRLGAGNGLKRLLQRYADANLEDAFVHCRATDDRLDMITIFARSGPTFSTCTLKRICPSIFTQRRLNG